mmetsp:Transcript_30703/g.40940  ORF Transcript_30703/g.40940 Transcript_30703/m.40940 type:complete len:508 (-) Transcript_30703:43-1566(-)
MTTHLKRSSILKRYYINIINDATTTQPNILRAVVARRSFVNNDIHPQQSQRCHKRYASFATSSIYNNLETRINLNHPSKKTDLISKRNLSSLSSSSSSTLSPAIIRKVQSMSNRHAEILSTLQSDEASSNDATALGKELSSLANVASLLDKLTSLEEEFKSIQELSEEAVNDEELQQECREEMDGLNEKKNLLEQCLIEAVIPKDDDDYGCDAILEIRAGTGGDEAALFANDLLTSYEKECKAKGWKFEILSQSKTVLGGIKEAAVSISGNGGGSYSSYETNETSIATEEETLNQLGPYGFYKFESGVHRVQRVPVNDVRIHTSAVSVAVLQATNDNATDASALLPTNELRIEVFRASGAGGQHVNTTESAVRITHIPTGITAAIQDERSQHKNKAKAMKLVSARVNEKRREEEARERGDARNSLMGGGNRSERIRTYNYPQDRITDHRCKHSEHGIVKLFEGGVDGVLSGLVGTFAPSMRRMYRDEMLQQLEEEEQEEKGKGKGKK